MLFSTSSLVIALLLAISASARPYEKRWGGWGGGSWRGNRGDEERHSWQPSAASPYVDFFKRAGISAGNCDLQSAIPNMNLDAGELQHLPYVTEESLTWTSQSCSPSAKP